MGHTITGEKREWDAQSEEAGAPRAPNVGKIGNIALVMKEGQKELLGVPEMAVNRVAHRSL